MREYWTLFDKQWIQVDEHAGGGWDYVRRFTPEFMKLARAKMNAALDSTSTRIEDRRVKMHDLSLTQFERFMQMLWGLQEGRLGDIAALSEKWLGTELHLADEYEAQFAFGKAYWTPSAHTVWFKGFFQPAYVDAGRIARNFNIISPPLRDWKYSVDREKTGEAQQLFRPELDDSTWPVTTLGVDTWYRLGIANFYGPVWYRNRINIPPVPQGKKVWLWVSREDGNVKVWVNGRHIPYVNANGEIMDEFKGGYGHPLSFDITAALKPGAENQITIRGTHTFVNELGTGGLLGPVYVYQEKLGALTP
jgi:hypothetical protein